MIAVFTRRKFLRSATAVTAAQVFAPGLHAFAGAPARAAWVAGNGGIHCLRNSGADWLRTAFVECDQPSALALHASRRMLYVAHATDSFEHLPAGSVSCYRVLQAGGLELLNRQGLSLSCVRPGAIAVSPQGDMLVVASGTSGILNVLPLDEHGVPSAVTAVRKELGWGVPSEKKAAGLHLTFNHDAELVAVQGQRALRYRCSQNEICGLGEAAGSCPPADRIPATLAAAIEAHRTETQSHSPTVWL